MSVIGAGVSLRGLHQENFNYTFNLATGIVVGDVGKAVSLDSTAANTVKLAGDGDTIIGYLETVENRVVEGVLVGTVATKGVYKLPVKTGLTGSEVVAVGSTAVGAGAGEIKALDDGNVTAAPNHNYNYVVEVGSGFAIVVLP